MAKLYRISFLLLLITTLFVVNLVNAQENTSYTNQLEKTISILEKTNNALSQQWTPINIILTTISVIFGFITILWGIIFAFGYIAYRNIKKNKKDLTGEIISLKRESRELLKLIKQDAEKMFGQLNKKGKKMSLGQLAKKLRELEEKSEKAIERLEDRATVTVSGTNLSNISPLNYTISGSSGSAFTFNPASYDVSSIEKKVCSKCGAFFKDTSLYGSGLISSYTSYSPPICKKCQEEGSKSEADTHSRD